MKIVRVPEGFSQENMQILSGRLKEEYPNERVIFISDAIDILDLSLRDLTRLREEIDKEISDRERIAPGERIKS